EEACPVTIDKGFLIIKITSKEEKDLIFVQVNGIAVAYCRLPYSAAMLYPWESTTQYNIVIIQREWCLFGINSFNGNKLTISILSEFSTLSEVYIKGKAYRCNDTTKQSFVLQEKLEGLSPTGDPYQTFGGKKKGFTLSGIVVTTLSYS
ncbi:hypothetical protein MAR_002717, partial [Mya arenaria]